MRGETTEPHLDFGSLVRGRFNYFPVVPGMLEFAMAVRRAILAQRPGVVALELPVTLREAYLRAIERLPQMTVIFYPEGEEDEAVYIPVEPCDPFTEAIRSGLAVGAEIVFTDPDMGERPHLPDTYPDTYALQSISVAQYVESYRVYPQERSEEIEHHADGIAWKLQGTDPLATVMVVLSLNLLDPVLDAMERPQAQPMTRVRREGVQLLNPHPESLVEICMEFPYLQARYEEFRMWMDKANLVDRRHVQHALYREAEKLYEVNTGERVEQWQRRTLAKYSRNLAVVNRDLVASLFDLTVAARSVVDDNYGWEVWDLAGKYAAQQEQSDLPTTKISADEVWINTKRIRLRRRVPSTKRRLRPVGLKARKKEKIPGEWASELNGDSICSYPPEDLVIEDYGRFLKKKGKSILSEERSRSEPFTTSLLDGIDLRETVRNWHERKIYVKSQEKVHGEVGSVVVIFDEDSAGRYNYMTTWLGEHQNESDMAFYSTFPFEHMVGPGIGRGEYGGFLMSLPARRMYDVWQDPDYDIAESKSERLLLAGLDYSVQKFVVYVAAKPPRTIFRSVAARFGRTIVYIPIGQLSPVTLKKIRVVHVLDGYDKRESAKEYLW
jgi:hypothetical protein